MRRPCAWKCSTYVSKLAVCSDNRWYNGHVKAAIALMLYSACGIIFGQTCALRFRSVCIERRMDESCWRLADGAWKQKKVSATCFSEYRPVAYVEF